MPLTTIYVAPPFGSPDNPIPAVSTVELARLYDAERGAVRIDGDDGDFFPVGKREHFFFIEYKSFSRGQAQTGRARFDHRLDRRNADDRNIETHVLVRLCDFYNR